jgi:beta-ketoacyl synthase-like protein
VLSWAILPILLKAHRIDIRSRNSKMAAARKQSVARWPTIGGPLKWKGLAALKSSLCVPALETTVRCRVAASGVLRGSAEAIAQWRKQPMVVGTAKWPISFLKHSDDQTVMAVQAVLWAMEQQGWQDRSFTDWGIIAAPGMFCRIANAQTIRRYEQEGAWGVAPNLIPHHSLHAISGTLSQLLKIHGPNLGVGGATNPETSALLIAGAMLMDRRLPGLWVVLTGHEAEWIPAADGSHPIAPICQAVALALTATDPTATGLHLSIGQIPEARGDQSLPLLHELSLGALADELPAVANVPSGKWRLADGYWLELETAFADAEGRS